MGVPPDDRLPGSLPTYWPCLGHRGLTACPRGTVRQYKYLKKAQQLGTYWVKHLRSTLQSLPQKCDQVLTWNTGRKQHVARAELQFHLTEALPGALGKEQCLLIMGTGPSCLIQNSQHINGGTYVTHGYNGDLTNQMLQSQHVYMQITHIYLVSI